MKDFELLNKQEQMPVQLSMAAPVEANMAKGPSANIKYQSIDDNQKYEEEKGGQDRISIGEDTDHELSLSRQDDSDLSELSDKDADEEEEEQRKLQSLRDAAQNKPTSAVVAMGDQRKKVEL